MDTCTSRKIRTGAGTLHVTTAGSGPAALLWHSMMVDSQQWVRVRDALAAHRTLVIVDGPGHGRSGPPPRGTSLDGCADAAVRVLDELGLDAVDWVGNAWGGHVGRGFASRYGARCRTLVAASAPPTPLPPAQRRRIRALVAAYALAGAAGPLRTAVTDALLGPSARADTSTVDLVTGAFAAPGRRGMLRVMTSMMLGRTDLTPRLARITTPTLLVAGAEDPMWSPRRAAVAAAQLPDATAIDIDDAGHLPPLETPEAFTAAVLDLWAR